MSPPSPSIAQERPRIAPLPLDQAMRLPARLRWDLVARYRGQGSYAAAAALLDEIGATSGDSATLREERARLAYVQEEYETALDLLRERVEQAPSPTALVGLGRLYLEVGDLEAAQEIAGQLARTAGSLVTVAAFLAEVERAAGDLAAARTRYRRLLAERPEHVSTLLALAGLEIEAGDERAARHFFDQALVTIGEGGSPNQLVTAAGVAEALGELDRAAELRGRAIAADALHVARLEAEIARALGAEAPEGAAPARPESGAAPPAAAPEMDPEPTEADAEPDVEALFPGTREALRRYFDHADFRPGQAAVIANVLARRDTLATMPTGAGKSLTFQLPAMLLDEVTLVISPLIALMKDQVEGLPPVVRERTALVNSTLAPEELRRVLDELADGRYRLVYAAPERLRQHTFLRALRAAGVGLVVIDEAHCISLWGHDFRPDYLAIPKALPELGEPAVLAITATATPAMARAIGGGLGRDLARVRVSLFRPNLFYEAHRCANREEKVKRLVQICIEQRQKGETCGIVYVSSRKDAEQIAGVLRDRGIGAIPYHAGLEPAARARNQDLFMRGDARARVVVATVAFGMGVDKPDVRFIVHLSPPRSLEAYAQESGRAGRDGRPARCVLLFAPADQTNLKRLARRDLPDLDDLRPVYAGLKRAAIGRWALVEPANLVPPPPPDTDPDDLVDPRVAIGILEQAGLVYRHPDAPVARLLRPLTGAAPERLPAEMTATWERFKTWAGLSEGRAGAAIQTAEACAALECSPGDLERLLGAQTEYAVRDERRVVCLEMLPAEAEAAANLRQVLERAKVEAARRIDQVMTYALGRGCRHATLAAHLGERLAPCRTACDVCTGASDGAAGPAEPAKAAVVTAADARAVIEAVRSLPFPMGKTGLIKLLLGSVESRVRADRSPAFGRLGHLPKARIEELIDRMVEDGLLARDVDHEFKVVTATRLGLGASDEMLAAYETRPRARATALIGAAESDDEALDPEDEALFARLVAWRRERASAEAVPPYVIAPDRTLRAIATARPRVPEALLRLHGLGQRRVERYGEELLAIVAAEA